MISEYEKLKLPDQNGKNDLIVEVNWNEKDKNTNESKVLRITCPDGSQTFVKREYFNSFLFLLGNPKEQNKMIPQKLSKVRWYETVLSVKASKDIRKGENITFPIKITLPAVEQEIIGEVAKSYQLPKKAIKRRKSGIFLPRK